MKLFTILFVIITALGASEEFDSVKRNYFKSYDYEQMGKYEEAIKALSPLYNKYPKGYTLNLRFGWLFFIDKKYKDAQKHYTKASLANPYALDPRLGLIRVYLATASYKEAEQSAYKLLKIDYYNYYANIYITQALIGERKFDIAHQIVLKMLALYPTDIAYLELLGLVYQNTDSPYLEKLYEDILVLDPNNIFVNTNRK